MDNTNQPKSESRKIKPRIQHVSTLGYVEVRNTPDDIQCGIVTKIAHIFT